MLHAVDKVNGTEMIEVMSKVDGRGSVALRQPIPDRSELDKRFNLALVCFHIYVFCAFLCSSLNSCNILSVLVTVAVVISVKVKHHPSFNITINLNVLKFIEQTSDARQ